MTSVPATPGPEAVGPSTSTREEPPCGGSSVARCRCNCKHWETIYKELGENGRYFAGWRWKLVAGYVTAIAAVGVAYGWAVDNHLPQLLQPLSGIACLFTVVMWLFEHKNRYTMRKLQECGKGMDECLPGPCAAVADTRKEYQITHTDILNATWCSLSAVFLIGFFCSTSTEGGISLTAKKLTAASAGGGVFLLFGYISFRNSTRHYRQDHASGTASDKDSLFWRVWEVFF